MKAADIMTEDLIQVTEDTPLKEVVRLMTAHSISGIPVVDAHNHLRGIISESDIIRRKRKIHMPDYIQLLEAMLNEADPDEFEHDIGAMLKQPVREFMTRQIITVGRNTSLGEITRLMVEHNIKRLPVVEDGLLVGIVTRRDVIRAFAALNDANGASFF